MSNKGLHKPPILKKKKKKKFCKNVSEGPCGPIPKGYTPLFLCWSEDLYSPNGHESELYEAVFIEMLVLDVNFTI